MWTQVEDQLSEQYEEDSNINSMMPGASHVDQCLVPPGYMLPDDGGDMVECPSGTYKEASLVEAAAAASLLVAHHRVCGSAQYIYC
jgi:hypothetical protein